MNYKKNQRLRKKDRFVRKIVSGKPVLFWPKPPEEVGVPLDVIMGCR
jgi:hypothetical protein